jgi:hypothetical protein
MINKMFPLNDNYVDFDLLTVSAKLSHLAYEDDINKNINSTISPIEFIDSKCWIFIDDKNGVLYIAFRGSDSLVDLLNNLNCLPKQYKDYGKVHAGYFHYYASVKTDVAKYVQKLRKHVKNVIVTGHSAAGPMAILSSLDIADLNKPVQCVTFGAPPMADMSFALAHMNKVPNTFRVVNVEDFAPKLPLPGLCHVGKPILLCNSPTECGLKDDPITMSTKMVYTHGMSRYVACLNQIKRSTSHLSFPLQLGKKFLV